MNPLKNENILKNLSLGEGDLLVLDRLQDLPTDGAFFSQYVLLVLCTAGKAQFLYDGVLTHLHAQQLFLGVPGSILSDIMMSADLDCKVLAIKSSEATSTHEMHRQIINSLLFIKAHPVTELEAADSTLVFRYFSLFVERLKGWHDRFFSGELHTLANAMLLAVLGLMDRKMEVDGGTSTVHGDRLVERFIRLVNEDCGVHRQVVFYASKLHITPKYLSTLVHAALGRTPSEVIQVVALKEIERRLRFTDDSMKEIAIDMNFPNASFFGKFFKRLSGVSPNQYRQRFSPTKP